MENTNRVSKYFSLPVLKLTELKARLASADAKYQVNTFPIKQKKYLFGIEIEVENCYNPLRGNYWTPTSDGSLRNHGVEYITPPLRLEQIEGALTEFQTLIPSDHSFSGRTSVHIHMNVRDLTISEIINLVTLYLVVERVLFKWVGHNRNNNPFCIPISDTNYYQQLTHILQHPENIRSVWNKYSALNLVPITEKGTIEFRHLYGTANINTIMTWVNLLACLKDKARKYTLDQILDMIKPLNTSSAYHAFINDIFDEFFIELQYDDIQELMEHNVTQIKLSYSKINQPTSVRSPSYATIADGAATRAGTRININNMMLRDLEHRPRVPGLYTTTINIDELMTAERDA